MNAESMSRGKCVAIAPGDFLPGFGMGELSAKGVSAECQVSRA